VATASERARSARLAGLASARARLGGKTAAELRAWGLSMHGRRGGRAMATHGRHILLETLAAARARRANRQ
jgi:hypothetical protein